MRQITVSTDVFSLLWAARQPGEESENDILLRLLSDTPELPAASQAEQGLLSGKPPEPPASSQADALKVAYAARALKAEHGLLSDTPEPPAAEQAAQGPSISARSHAVPPSLRHAYWWQIVEYVLKKLGRPSSLSEIYRGVTTVCRDLDRRMPQELEATVRGTLEDNSSDSERFKGVRDIFCMPRGKHAGVWSLRQRG